MDLEKMSYCLIVVKGADIQSDDGFSLLFFRDIYMRNSPTASHVLHHAFLPINLNLTMGN